MITAWNFLRFTCEYVKKIKPHVKIIVGGGIITSTPHSFLSVAPADVGVIGEGEDRILELVRAIVNDKPLNEVKSIVYSQDGEIKQTVMGSQIENLDSIPFPAWDLFDVANTYACSPSHSSPLKAKRQISIATSRGCPYQCIFCYTEKKMRYRSIDNVLAEMEELKGRYGIRHFTLADDLFVAKKERVIQFCNELIHRKMNVSWSAAGRCNLADLDLFKLMKSAGCNEIGLGIESGSTVVLNAIKKRQTPEQIIDAVRLVRQAGIEPGGTFILGLPSETPATVRETVGVYKEINLYRSGVNRFFFATPYPGTELYAKMREKGRIPNEVGFFEKLSSRGDAVDFVLNCTDAFTDQELIRTKSEIENEVFLDFFKKHPLFAFSQYMNQKTLWGKIKTIFLRIKMRGLIDTLQFLVIKLGVKLGLYPNPFERRWTKI